MLNSDAREALDDAAEFLKEIAPTLGQEHRSRAYLYAGVLTGIREGDELVNNGEWNCVTCDQRNAGWAVVCGRCGRRRT
jgi:hypothetical protein